MSSISIINTIGYPFTELDEIDSTNNYAFDQLQANLAAHGAAFFAHKQTAGKGQRGKQWETQPNSNLILSVILDMSFFSVNKQFLLSAAMALAVHDFFNKYAGDETKIKWPNDIYWRDRKAGGILIESSITAGKPIIGSWKWAVVGIGININQTSFPTNLVNPVSLKQITGKSYDTVTLAKELCHCLEFRYQELKNGESKKSIDTYNLHLYKKQETVRLKKENAAFKCKIEGVNKKGMLLVTGAAKESFTFGEVSWVL